MRILYAALDQQVPGTLGGSVHVQAVAEGLAALGHEVHVATTPGGPWPSGSVHWHAMSSPLGRHELRWMRARALTRLARRVGRGGRDRALLQLRRRGRDGRQAAGRAGGAGSERADHRLPRLAEGPRRSHACCSNRCAAGAIGCAGKPISSSRRARTSCRPGWIARKCSRPSGAPMSITSIRVRPARCRSTRDPNRVLCVFAGAFRSWHGVTQLSAALARLHAQGEHRLGAVFIGDGPERAAAERAARDVPGITFTGAVPHDQLPQCLAAADIGVAPFDPARHKPLTLGFYWSPLKIFEYMSAGLPVVAPRLPRVASLISDGEEGLLYDPRIREPLTRRSCGSPIESLRERLGHAARTRAVAQYSWRAHCAMLDERLRALVAAAPAHTDDHATHPARHGLVPAGLRRHRAGARSSSRATFTRADTSSLSFTSSRATSTASTRPRTKAFRSRSSSVACRMCRWSGTS